MREGIEAYGLASIGLVRGVYEVYVEPFVRENRDLVLCAAIGFSAVYLADRVLHD
jgi:hypothetical protein